MVPDYLNMKKQKRVGRGPVVSTLDLHENGGFDQLKMKRDKWEVRTTGHNKTHSSKNDKGGEMTEHLTELIN